jgi:RNA polymerase sigma factor FliA
MDREKLILALLPQVRLIAKCLHRRLPRHVPIDDLISAGMLGAIAAVDRFDPGLGAELKAYAKHKIRGAILDDLRATYWQPRYQRDQRKEIGAAIDALRKEHQCEPGEDEVAARMGISLEEYQKRRLDSDISLLRLDRPFEEGSGPHLALPDPEPLPDIRAAASAEARRMATAIAQLGQREQTVIRLYFYEDLSLREIGERLSVGESRATQLKTKALARLHAQLNGYGHLTNRECLRWSREHRQVFSQAQQRRRASERPRLAEAA